ncbi:hypothetical protein [Acinetobacter larvae]|uniref:Phage protein n=1 Tax=Acinetobacter larvae TaxID=1789224 RepID=A0A1B2LXA0_9GAMM|nr:hypothetical protein [Acinetobacter larvae]AOA57574.1 hypothetical protein BFG52_03870 [Acinetobacter larvae]
MSWAAVAAVAAAAGAAIAGYSSYTSNKTASKQAEADADAQKAQGRVEAERIRRQKEKVQSAARAAAAENGLDVNEGTAITINDQIERDGQYDMEVARQTGVNSSNRLMAESNVYKRNANMGALSGALNVASTATSFKSANSSSTALSSKKSANTGKGWK